MSAFLIVVYVVCGVYMLFNFKHDIHMLQQNSYRIPRYWKYLKNDIGSAWRLTDVAMLFLLFATLLDVRLALLIIAIVCVAKIWLIFRKKFKKPLVFTKRVWRIYGVTALLALGGYLAVILSTGDRACLWGGYHASQFSVGIMLLISIFSWGVVIRLPYYVRCQTLQLSELRVLTARRAPSITLTAFFRSNSKCL